MVLGREKLRGGVVIISLILCARIVVKSVSHNRSLGIVHNGHNFVSQILKILSHQLLTENLLKDFDSVGKWMLLISEQVG